MSLIPAVIFVEKLIFLISNSSLFYEGLYGLDEPEKKKYRYLMLNLLLFKEVYFIKGFCFTSPALNLHVSMIQWDLEN